MTVRADEWYRTQVDRKTLKALSRRSDREPLIHFGCYFALLGTLGAALVWTWATLWAVPVMLVYSAVWSFANANGHEACHCTPFRNQKLNTLLLYISSWMLNWEPTTVRWVHAKHHSYTSIVDKDAEYLLANPIRWSEMIGLILGVQQVWHYNKELVQLCFGYANPVIREAVPASERYKVYRDARLFAASYLLIIGVAVAMQSWLLICLLILPRIVGEPMHGILRITQHGGLATGVQDHRLTTRTMQLGPLMRFFYCNMNYHIEHHMFPMVPFYSLPKLHETVKGELPRPSAGVIGAMGEVFIAMKAQRAQPDYHLRKAAL